MKKTMIAVFVILGLIVFSVPMAMATPYTATIYNSTGNGPGGEFTIDPNGFEWVLNNYSSNTSSATTFQTFCVEKNEFIDFGQTYDASIADSAVEGGVGGGSPDPLSLGSAWLYHQFQSGILTGYDYDGANRAASADELQDAFWMLENEIGWGSNYFIDSVLFVESPYTNQSAAIVANNGAISVAVLNLYDQTTGEVKQSQLVCVPDASIMLLLGPALIGMGILGRRRKVNNL